MRPLYIFDLDGTLALTDHRQHLLESNERDKWRRFYAACDKDLPNTPVLRILEMLRLGADVWIFSGRSDEVRTKTVEWLCRHTSFNPWQLEPGGILTMRAEGDYTADDVLKKQWLDAMLVDDRQRLAAVFDDRDRVVKMWRDAGITCLQVAAGEF